MKKKTPLILTAITLVSALLFTNCKKEATGIIPQQTTSSLLTPIRSTLVFQSDRIDEIVRGLAQDSYSLNFEKPMPSVGITRTAYGADSYVVYADPQDLICPDPIRFRQKLVPIWKIPNFIQPTCPDMVIDLDKLRQIGDLVVKGNQQLYGDLQVIKTTNGGGLLADKKFTGQFANQQLDKIDAITRDLNPEKYVLFNAPGDFSGGFTRCSYGYADLNINVLRAYKLNLKDILKPTLKGCFDPLVLSTIRERLEAVNPALYKGLNVTPIADGSQAAVLSF
jgi:hypothetical protein